MAAFDHGNEHNLDYSVIYCRIKLEGAQQWAIFDAIIIA